MHNVAIPEMRLTPAITNSPPSKLPVRSLMKPMTNGPTKPEILAIELIYATPAAAAVPLRNAVGMAQNTGNTENEPNAATDSPTIRIYGLGVNATATMPIAVIMKQMQVWLRRSIRRSERLPYQIIPHAPMANGMADTRPVCMLLNPNAFTI